MADSASAHHDAEDESRRDFLYLAAGAMGLVGAGAVAWPFIASLNPAADVLALASIEVDLAPIEVGQAITVTWRGKPVFIRHRTEEEINEARSVEVANLRDPQADEERAIKPQYLVMIGVCTHLGCIPLGNKEGQPKGDFGGWFCPCHGSHYDTSGRVRKGPAPENLIVPDYQYLEETTIQIG